MLPPKYELEKRYSSYSNDRLLSIIYSKDQYTQQALEVVKAELYRRNVGAAEVDVFLDEQEEKQLAGQEQSTVPLALWEKILFFFAWFAPWFLGGALRLNYEEDGLLLKAKQSKVFAIAGFTLLMLDVFVSVYADFGNLASIALLVAFFLVFLAFEKRIEYDIRL